MTRWRSAPLPCFDWFKLKKKTISFESLDSWFSINQSEIKNKGLVRSSAYQKFPNAKERCLPTAIAFVSETIKLPSPVRSFSLGEISAHTTWSSFWRSVFRNSQGAPRQSAFNQKDDGQGVARWPSMTFWTVLRSLEFNIFQRFLHL